MTKSVRKKVMAFYPILNITIIPILGIVYDLECAEKSNGFFSLLVEV